SKNNKTMENKEEIMVITQLLTKLRFQKKVIEFNLYNVKNFTEKQINSHLDEKTRIEKSIRILEEKLRELEK
ncbi:MAG: hypothetical protein J6C58_00365, partial [Bacteroidaceae bacterium]|nr:hypothetical protein [Bacteroidaceae bacterium]